MAFYWDKDIDRSMRVRWTWVKRRVLWLFTRCNRSNKLLFLRTAYKGIRSTDYGYIGNIWLSQKEYMLKVLRDE